MEVDEEPCDKIEKCDTIKNNKIDQTKLLFAYIDKFIKKYKWSYTQIYEKSINKFKYLALVENYAQKGNTTVRQIIKKYILAYYELKKYKDFYNENCKSDLKFYNKYKNIKIKDPKKIRRFTKVSKRICECNDIKDNCKECALIHICEHEINSNKCILCSNDVICDHSRIKKKCSLCKNSTKCVVKNCESLIYKYKINKNDSSPQNLCLKCHMENGIDVLDIFNSKEMYIFVAIIEKFKNYHWSVDNRVKLGYSKRRPDMILYLHDRNIIVEIDENSHPNYENESGRINEIHKDLNFQELIVIRFNPDSYYEKGKRIGSIFKRDKGKIIIGNKNNYDNRIKILETEIQKSISKKLIANLEIIKLFYIKELCIG